LNSELPPYRPPSPFIPFLRRFTDERARDLSDTRALYEKVRAAHLASPFADPDIVERIHNTIATEVGETVTLPSYRPLLEAFDKAMRALLLQETTIFALPDMRWELAILSIKEQVDLRRFLRAKEHFLGNRERVLDILGRTLGDVFGGILGELPPIAGTDEEIFQIPLVALLPNVGNIVERITSTVVDEAVIDVGLLRELQERLYDNACRASGIDPHGESKRPIVTAGESELPPEELIDAYLSGTPLQDLLLTPVPFVLPEQARFEHHWIVAGTGHGKTQTLQSLICRDLAAVAKGAASIVVIDSQGDLINTIAGLKLFAAGQPLDGTLCLIDPTDIEFPVQLNLFSLGTERLDSYSKLDRERLLNSIIELYDFVLAALLGAEMTSKQSVIFRFVTRALLHIPDATVHTLLELMEPGGDQKYQQHIAKLQGAARSFFANEFNSAQFAETKRQVLRRLYGVLENQTFERMFSHPKSKLDIFKEMNSGKVILINAAKDLLKQNGTEVFGRFFIALIAQAAAERATLTPNQRLPTFVYIDECQDYIASDSNFTGILEQARKQKVGLVVAHQYLTQLSQGILDSLHANTSIKFAGGVSDRDAHALARNMRTTPDFLESQGKGSFAAYVRNVTPHAVSLRIPFGRLEDQERMTPAEAMALRDRMRAHYAVPFAEARQADNNPPLPTAGTRELCRSLLATCRPCGAMPGAHSCRATIFQGEHSHPIRLAVIHSRPYRTFYFRRAALIKVLWRPRSKPRRAPACRDRPRQDVPGSGVTIRHRCGSPRMTSPPSAMSPSIAFYARPISSRCWSGRPRNSSDGSPRSITTATSTGRAPSSTITRPPAALRLSTRLATRVRRSSPRSTALSARKSIGPIRTAPPAACSSSTRC